VDEHSAVAGRRLVVAAGLATTLLTVALALSRPAVLVQLDNRIYDALVRSLPPTPPSERVAIVDVDERSLSMVGQWPWRRDVIARLITTLRDLGAAVVAFDIVFAEPDRYEAAAAMPPAGAADAALVSALRQGGVVLGYAFSFGQPHHGSQRCLLHPIAVPVVQAHGGTVDPPVFHAATATCGLPALAEAAGGSGFLNAVPDPDGVLRRVPLLVGYDGHLYPGLGLAAAMAADHASAVALRTLNVNAASLVLDGAAVPLDGRSNLLLRFRGGKRSFPYVSAADVLEGKAPAATIKNAVVFIGATAPGIREIVSTPFDTLVAGVEVHATVADNLLRRDFLARAPDALTFELMAILIAGSAIALLASRAGLQWTSLSGLALLAALWPLARLMLERDGHYFSPIFPAIAVVASLSAVLVGSFFQERRRAVEAVGEKELARRLMVQSLLSLIEIRDADTGGHSRRTQRYSRLLAEQLRDHPAFRAYLTPARINLLTSLAPLHDIGKVGVPDQLLNKPGPLTRDEYEEMKKHPDYGLSVITTAQRNAGAADDAILAMVREIVYTHHERWDGKGYPRGLEGKQIPIAGRMMAIVDVYDALTSSRCYRPAMSHDTALTVLRDGSGSHFDPVVVDAFLRVAPHLQDAATHAAVLGGSTAEHVALS
jgi:adenylate cyclase